MFWKKRKISRKKLPAGEERRREPRQDDSSEVTIELEAEAPGRRKRIYYGRATNASPSGLKIRVDVQFPIETLLELKFQSTRTRKVIEAKGIVKWVHFIREEKGFEIGVEFAGTPVKTIMEIIDHLYKA